MLKHIQNGVLKKSPIAEKPPSNYIESVMNHFKCAVGAGIFSLGFAYNNAGMALAPPVLILVGCLLLYCQHLLVRVAKVLEEEGITMKTDFGEACKGAFLRGPGKCPEYASSMKTIANIILMITQFGICCTYILFFSESMKWVAEIHGVNWSIFWFIAIAFIPIWLLSSFLLNLKVLAVLSTVANMLVLFSIILAIYLMGESLPQEPTFRWIGDVDQFPLFISTGIYTFCSIMVVLPLHMEINNKELMTVSWGVLNISTILEGTVTILVGTLSYLRYGDESKGSITLNFGDTVEQLDEKPPSNYIESVMNHFKCTVGAGIFTLGFAYKNAGLILAPPVLVLVVILMLHCQHLLLKTAKVLEEEGKLLRTDFGETCKGAFMRGPGKCPHYASAMKTLSNVILMITQFGVCCTYILFFSESMKWVAQKHSSSLGIIWFILFAFPPIWVMSSFFVNLKVLSILSAIANILIMTSILIAIYLMGSSLPKEQTFSWIGDLIKFPIFVSTSIYTFCSIMMVLPLYVEIKNKEWMSISWGVLNVSTLLEALTTILVGTLSYIRYGDESKGSVTMNFEEDTVSEVCVILLALCILLTYALQMYIIIDTLYALIHIKFGPFTHPALVIHLFRTSMIIASFLLAAAIPILGLVISLVGAIGQTSLALLLPPIIHLACFYAELTIIGKIKDWAIIIFAFLAVIVGATSAIIAIVFELQRIYSGEATTTAAPITTLAP